MCAPSCLASGPLSCAARDGHGAIAALGRVLDGQVTQAADAQDRDGVAGARAAVAQAC